MTLKNWLRPRVHRKKQRQIFVVREIDPLGAIKKCIEKGSLVPQEYQDKLIYLRNNITVQVPEGKVILVNLGTEDAELTLGHVYRSLRSYEIVRWRETGFPPLTRSHPRAWFRQVIDETSDDPEGTLIIVVDRSTFDIWLTRLTKSKLSTRNDSSCIMKLDESGSVIVAA